MASHLSRLRARVQDAVGKEFTVGDVLGEGGFATVFRARDKSLGRDVAVKVLDLQVAPSPSLAERFVREAQTVGGLEHPNIVPIHKVGGQGKILYIIMRYVDGPSVRALLDQRGRLAVGDAARIARAVADALQYAHERGIVHRDVKPDNILLDSTGHVLVTDFGIAKAAEAAKTAAQGPLTTEGMVLGTPQYMSPEQAAGERLDGRSDIYSLGVVLYHMLAGEPPFDGDSAQAVLAKQLTATPTSIRTLRSDVPAALDAVLDRMLAKDPARRFTTAAEVSRALVSAQPTAAHEQVQALGRQVAIRSALGVTFTGCLTFVAVVVGAALVYWEVISQPPALKVAAPAPGAVTQDLRRRGLLVGNEAVEFAYAPDGPLRTTVFVVTRRRVAIGSGGAGKAGVGGGTVRRYPRDSVAYRFAVRTAGGLGADLVLLVPPGRVDTVYAGLSPRAAIEMAYALRGRLRPDPAGGPGLPFIGR